MRITVSTFDDRVVTVELDPSASFSTFKLVLEAETGLPSSAQVVMLNGKVVGGDESTLESLGFENDCLAILERRLAAGPRSGMGGGTSGVGSSQPNLGDMNPDGSAKNPQLLMDFFSAGRNTDNLPPALAAAVSSRNIEAMQEALRSLQQAALKRKEEEERFMRLAAEDPMNIEVQQKLEEIIRQKNVEENYEKAMEHNPEAFATVSMLYVDMTVNGVKQPAFIDSGAQSSVMGKTTAEKCGLLRLMDTRFAGKAVGVGTGKILGRVHMAPVEINGHHIPVSIAVMEQDGMDFLFGLDNMKRHQCSIDLRKNVLRFPGMDGGKDLEMPFLPEHLIPKGSMADLSENTPGEEEKQSREGEKNPESKVLPGGCAVTPPAPPAPATTQHVSESKISTLMALGFPREACIQALVAAGGNEEIAASLLFSA